MLKSRLALGLAFAAAAATAQGEEHVVGQKGRAFSAGQLTVKAGDTVSFRNDDPFFHNVFSLSETHSFDLGSYPRGQARATRFDKPGKVEVECAIHPEMKMVVEVKK